MEKLNVPASFGYCIADATQCPLASRCLRTKALESQKEEIEQLYFVSTVNPFLKDCSYATTECARYIPAERLRFATGMKHIYDNVPQRLIKTLRAKVRFLFSSTRIYYYCKAGKRLISPAIQEAIAQMFKNYGITEPPQFDRYVMEYDWNG